MKRQVMQWCSRGAMIMGAVFFVPALFAQNPIHVTYLWHMHQPIYYPRLSVNDTDNSGNFNFSVRGVHDSRTGPYTDWPKNAVQQSADRSMPNAGVQVSFSGSLMENLNGIWGSDWRDHYRWGRNGLRTANDNPRIDLVGFAYHHSLMPLTHRESMKMQIRLHREAYIDNWDTGGGYSKGFFPPESSFANHMIPALVSEGIEWILVDSGHIDRTLEDFPWSPASSIRPNRADKRNGVAADWNSQWTQLQNVWAPTPVAAPFSYQPRRMRYVDPYSDPQNPTVHSMIAVPAGRYEGNENARGGYGAFKPENVWGPSVDRNNDPSRPMLLVAHSDGDNFGMLNADVYHGQHGLFLDMVQSNPDFAHSSVQDYLDMHPLPPNDPYIHVEPGSWIGIDGGTPFFDKWIEYNERDGEHPDHWNWSVLMAALNRVLHAQDLEGTFSMNDVRWGIGPDTAKAWHHYLNAEASDYWYWDFDRANPWDGNVTRAANLSVAEANKVIARHPGVDNTGPTIFHPQRPVWNPGGKAYDEPGNSPSDFEVWSFVDDVSGVTSVRLYWRTADWDSYNDLNDFAQEIYAHTPGKNSAWTIEPMSGAWYPPVKGPLVPDPLGRAMKYTAFVEGQSETLVSYFVEAVDGAGNTNRSDIKHVWVGESTEGGGGTGPRVEFDPPAPDGCEPVTIKCLKAGSPLGSDPVYIHVGRNGWQDSIQPNPLMTDDGDYWVYTYVTPAETEEINVVFNNGAGAWDNNGGLDWRVTVLNCATNGGGGPIMPTVWTDPESPDGCGPVTIYYNPNGRPLLGSDPIHIHVGRNGWEDVILPNPVMTLSTGIWSYVYTPAPGTTNINFVFNDGAAIWDNNSDQDWAVSVTGCEEGPPPPSGLAITNPATDIVVGNAVASYDLQGIAETVAGDLVWTNELTGETGTLPVANPWVLSGLSLGVGANVITVSGTNDLPAGVITTAVDTASNYGGNWTDTSEGTGFGGWAFFTSSEIGGENGRFLGDGANVGDPSWGLYANGGNLSEAKRFLNGTLAVGQTLSVRMKNGFLDAGAGAGVAVQNSAGETLWQFFFNGGDDYYSMSGATNDIGWTADGLDIAFTLATPSTFNAVITPIGGSTRNLTGDLDPQTDMDIAVIRLWNFNAGSGSDRDVFFNDLVVTELGAGGILTTSATVTITRQVGGDDTNGDGIPDAWYEAYSIDPTTPGLAQQTIPGRPDTYWDAYVTDTDPTDPSDVYPNVIQVMNDVGGSLRLQAGPPTSPNRRYDVFWNDDLHAGAWTPMGLDVMGQGDRSERWLEVTNAVPYRYYRTGVLLPGQP